MNLIIYTDGASRDNPGYAAIGYIIMRDKKILEERGEYIGVTTNNQAEYRALIKALKAARKYEPEKITCYSDSKLMINQLNGEWKVKDVQLQDLHSEIKRLEKDFKKVKYLHVNRDNPGVSRCDALANRALDAQTKPL
jgi:ribonuclease HI